MSARWRFKYIRNRRLTILNGFFFLRVFGWIFWLLLGGREKGIGCNVNNNSKCYRLVVKGSC